MNLCLLAFVNMHKSNRQTRPPRCPLIHCSNWELLAQKTTHNQTWGGSRPLSQLCPLSLMSLNDFNILPCHNLANRCQFSVTTWPIGYLPLLWPRSNDDVQFNISVNLYSKASKSENERRVNWFQRWYLDLHLEINADVLLISRQIWWRRGGSRRDQCWC